jgi:adenine-specific DNA-methyltransferase
MPTSTSLFDSPHRSLDHVQTTVYCGPVLEMVQELSRNTFDLIVSSPPYNIGKSYETKRTIDDYLTEQATVIAALAPLLTEQGSICWQVGNYIDKGEVFPLDIYFYPIFKSLGFQLRNRIIWSFGHGLHASKRFSGRYETILWFSKSDSYIFNLDSVRVPSKYPGKLHFKGPKKGLPSGNPLGKNPADIWEVVVQDWENEIWDIPNVKSNHPEKTIHPCQFPVELVERCVLALTHEGSWILDPFAGVGSSLIAALKHGRHAVGIDQNEEYCTVARQRIEALRNGTLPLRPINKPIHQPSGREKVAQIPDEWKPALHS